MTSTETSEVLEQQHKDRTEALIEEIELKDRWFRRFQSVTSVILLALILVVLSLQTVQLRHQQNDVSQTNQQISCISRFFAQTSRSDKSIANIDTCNIVQASK